MYITDACFFSRFLKTLCRFAKQNQRINLCFYKLHHFFKRGQFITPAGN